MKYDKKYFENLGWVAFIGIVVFVVVVLVFFPFLLIWCVNILGPALSIPYNFYTWLATWILWWFTWGRTAVQLNQIKEKL